jgi:opacity protein-like surface antigen
MKSLTATLVVLATVLASPAFAAQARHRSPAVQAGSNAYGQVTSGQFGNGRFNGQARSGDTVVYGNRVIGQDPDPNIRAQMLHDPVPSDY